MSDLISRELLLNAMEKRYQYARKRVPDTLTQGFIQMEKLIKQQPTIEAVPVVHGFNDNRKFHEVDEFRCSVCGLHLEDWQRCIHDEETNDVHFQGFVFKYCPNCGAKMK